MAALSSIEPSFDVDKLSYEIFSILESKFLFGYDDPKIYLAGKPPVTNISVQNPTGNLKSGKNGKVRILSIDGGGATDGILAGKSLAHLEDSLRQKSGDPNARIADFFDVVAGTGTGGILAAMLFTRGKDGRPLFKADEALRFLVENRRRISPSGGGIFRRIFRPSTAGKVFRRTFSESTMRDTLKPVLIPCYDLSTGAPFLFSRADALETDSYDFKMREVCVATSADPSVVGAVEMRSVDERTRIVAVDGGVAMNNPTAAAITHVLNNKQEFPFSGGVDDLLVISLGNGELDSVSCGRRSMTQSPEEFVRIAGDGVSDMVDQAVSMAFGDSRTSNYVRIQANGFNAGKFAISKKPNSGESKRLMLIAEEMLTQKNVESVLFRGKKISEKTNAEKIDWFAGELMKEHERRKSSSLPTVVLKQATPRTSSATTSSC